MSLSELIDALGKAKIASNNAYEAYKELKGIEDEIRYELEATLNASGLRSVKGSTYTASIAQKPTIVIQQEQLIIEWLKGAPNIEYDHYIGLKATEFKKLAEVLLKDTGEVIPGTDVEIRESLSIRSNVKKGK